MGAIALISVDDIYSHALGAWLSIAECFTLMA
jgi:hypothetical protein